MYLAPQNIPGAVVLTPGNKVVLCYVVMTVMMMKLTTVMMMMVTNYFSLGSIFKGLSLLQKTNKQLKTNSTSGIMRDAKLGGKTLN